MCWLTANAQACPDDVLAWPIRPSPLCPTAAVELTPAQRSLRLLLTCCQLSGVHAVLQCGGRRRLVRLQLLVVVLLLLLLVVVLLILLLRLRHLLVVVLLELLELPLVPLLRSWGGKRAGASGSRAPAICTATNGQVLKTEMLFFTRAASCSSTGDPRGRQAGGARLAA